MAKIKNGSTRISFDFPTPEVAIDFWENFLEENPDYGNCHLVMEDGLHKLQSKNSWLVRLQRKGTGRPIEYKKEFNTVYKIEVGTNMGINLEV